MPDKNPTIRKPWTHEELLLVLHLYFRIPFGRQHHRAKEVVELADLIGRTPSSVAMKLNNLTSLDPLERARGVVGLDSASKLDRQMWLEYSTKAEVIEESETTWLRTFKKPLAPAEPTASPANMPAAFGGENTEALVTKKARLAQSFFRRSILSLYDNKCCITGIQIPELLRASHIIPWSEEPLERTNPRNGLCLSALHDAAFDNHLISIDKDYKVVLAPVLKASSHVASIELNFLLIEGTQIHLPDKFLPDQKFLAAHRQKLK